MTDGKKAALAFLALGVLGAVVYSSGAFAKSTPGPAPGPSPKPPGGGGGGGGKAPRPPSELEDVDPENYTDPERAIVLRDLVARATATKDVMEAQAILIEFDAWAGAMKPASRAAPDVQNGHAFITDRRNVLALAFYNSLMALPNSDSNVGSLLHWAQAFGEFGSDWHGKANALQDKAARMQEKIERARDAASIRAQCAQMERDMRQGGAPAADIQREKSNCMAYANAIQNG